MYILTSIGIFKNLAPLNGEVPLAAPLFKRCVLRQWRDMASLDLAHGEPWEGAQVSGENQMRGGVTGSV